MATTAARSAGADTRTGSLVVVGTGIRAVGQLTVEAIAWMRNADVLLYLVGDPVAEQIVIDLNPKAAESMAGYYQEHAPRIGTYLAMVERVLRSVREGNLTVTAYYGHPGVFAFPSHESVRRARAEGYAATMLPGVSAEDCLFADLGVDPAIGGCQSYEATDFVVNRRLVDPTAQLVLWQVGSVGDATYQRYRYDSRWFPLLIQRLCEIYPPSHPATIYEASTLPGVAPQISTLPIAYLHHGLTSAATTLYVPPVGAPQA